MAETAAATTPAPAKPMQFTNEYAGVFKGLGIALSVLGGFIFAVQVVSPTKDSNDDLIAGGLALGVGLALSRRFIDKMGGRIDVSSAVGEGSRFTVVLACAEPHPLRAGL